MPDSNGSADEPFHIADQAGHSFAKNTNECGLSGKANLRQFLGIFVMAGARLWMVVTRVGDTAKIVSSALLANSGAGSLLAKQGGAFVGWFLTQFQR